MSGLARFGKLPVERRIVSPPFFPESLKLLLALSQVLIHSISIRYVESQGTEDLVETQRRKRLSDSLGGLTSQKCKDHRVQRNARVFDEVAAIALLDVFRNHRSNLSQYMPTNRAWRLVCHKPI